MQPRQRLGQRRRVPSSSVLGLPCRGGGKFGRFSAALQIPGYPMGDRNGASDADLGQRLLMAESGSSQPRPIAVSR